MRVAKHARQTLILGPPGTGKTTRLLNIMEAALARGVKPNKIAFVSFTKKAVEEAAQRAAERFNLAKTDLVYFRTLHSLAFRLIGVRRDEVMQAKHYHELGALLGVTFSTRFDAEEGIPSSQFLGDRYVFLDGLARSKCMTPEAVWEVMGHEELDWFEFKRFVATLKAFKKSRCLIDFSDMLEMAEGMADVDIVIMDEAQDLSTLQWNFASKVFCNAAEVYIGADDDQGIFQWSGADIDRVLNLDGTRTILDQSWRIPRSVHDLAIGISSQISRRFDKPFKPRDEVGLVEWHRQADDVDLSSGTWLLLARNIHLLQGLVRTVRESGIPYSFRGEPAVSVNHQKAIRWWEDARKGILLSQDQRNLVEQFMPVPLRGKTWINTIWHEALTKISRNDREYYISLLRRGESLLRTPRINISTIHGVKGGEADNVMLLTDMSPKTYEGYLQDQDTEHRVFYVGATRTRNALHIIEPQTRCYYTI